MNMTVIKNFLVRKGVQPSFKKYILEALSAMSVGLFASLLIGVILKTIGQQLNIELLQQVGTSAMSQMPQAIAVAVAFSLNAPFLVLCSAVVVGNIAANSSPAGIFIASLIATEIGKLISKETKLDLLITPFVVIITAFFVALFLSPIFDSLMKFLGSQIVIATTYQPFLMSIVVATIVGLTLTAPISSAALCIMLDLNGLVAGAATIGCCAQMIGFATISYKENGLNGFIAQGLGTSMLQIANIVKNPFILIPPTLAGACLAPFAYFLDLKNNAIGAGMGTSGLVGPINTFVSLGWNKEVFFKVACFHFILPALLSFIFYKIMVKFDFIKVGDLTLFNDKN